jgi:peptide/nickel transport system permease protein
VLPCFTVVLIALWPEPSSAVITLGYLGLGIQPPTPDWGSMIADNRAFITSQWWLPAMPGFAVVVTGLGFALLADGIADVWRVRR